MTGAEAGGTALSGRRPRPFVAAAGVVVIVVVGVTGPADPTGAAGMEKRPKAGAAASVAAARSPSPAGAAEAVTRSQPKALGAQARDGAPTGGGGSSGSDAGAAPSPADAARAEARRILAERRFRPSRTPRPLRGVLRRLGGWIRPVADPVRRLWEEVAGSFLWRAVLVTAVVGVAALSSIRLVRRRNAAGVAQGTRERRRRQDDPDELERRADRAEREGHLDLAFRLRFRAGLLRLDVAGIVPWRPSLTTGQLTEEVRSPTLAELADAFDEITYGGRSAAPADLEAARTGWPRVLHDAELGDRRGARAPLRTPGSAPSREPGDRGGVGTPLR